MNPIMCVLGFLGSVVVYCLVVLVLDAFVSGILKHETTLNDDNFWFDICTVQFGIVLVVLAIYFSNMMFEVS